MLVVSLIVLYLFSLSLFSRLVSVWTCICKWHFNLNKNKNTMNMLPWCLKEVINTIIASIILYALAISVLKFSTEMTKSLESNLNNNKNTIFSPKKKKPPYKEKHNHGIPFFFFFNFNSIV